VKQKPTCKAPALALGLLALALAACGRSATSLRRPVATATATPPPTATATLPPTATVTPAQPASALPSEQCPDPYPQGAPYAPAPGQPIHLRPNGAPPPLPQYQAIALVSDPALEGIVRNALGTDVSHFAVAVKRLDNGKGVVIDGGRVFYAASLFKVWVMLEAFHQRQAGLLSFDERYIVSDYYASLSLNPGELPLCSQVTAQAALREMMSVSDNIAANIMLERVGYANVNAMLRNQGLAVSGVASNGDVSTTASGMEQLLEAIARQEAVSAEASAEMLSLLASEVIDSRLPALLPPEARVAHKTGSWDNATHDAGIVYSPKAAYVIVVLSDLGYENDGNSYIAQLSRAVYDYFNPE
jgi:beta-lactamase class A